MRSISHVYHSIHIASLQKLEDALIQTDIKITTYGYGKTELYKIKLSVENQKS